MRFRVAFEQPDRARGIGPQQIEQIGGGFGDAQEHGSGARKPHQQIVDGSRLLGRDIGQPVYQSLLGFIGRGHMRSVHKPRGKCGGFHIRFSVFASRHSECQIHRT
jgi:hypothetical protein